MNELLDSGRWALVLVTLGCRWSPVGLLETLIGKSFKQESQDLSKVHLNYTFAMVNKRRMIEIAHEQVG